MGVMSSRKVPIASSVLSRRWREEDGLRPLEAGLRIREEPRGGVRGGEVVDGVGKAVLSFRLPVCMRRGERGGLFS